MALEFSREKNPAPASDERRAEIDLQRLEHALRRNIEATHDLQALPRLARAFAFLLGARVQGHEGHKLF